jgi:transcriptional regulator with XRE-family HTH domain
VAFRYNEIGNRLKAYRLGSDLSADEIADQLGISRTALYRFEKGEIAKIDTLERLAELLGVSIATLLGVDIEYIPSAISYFERLRQIEEASDHIIAMSGPISLLLSSDDFMPTLEEVITENVPREVTNRKRTLGEIPMLMGILRARKTIYQKRRPSIVSLMSALEIERFLHHGLIGRSGLPAATIEHRKMRARDEIEHFVSLLESPPIGVQIGIVTDTLPNTGFQIFRQPNRRILVMSPFRLGSEPNIRVGVAMITSATDALSFHEASVDEMWGRALKGEVAATLVRHLLANERLPADGGFGEETLIPKRRLRTNPSALM